MATKQHVDDLGKILKSTTNIHTKAISNSGASEDNIKKATEVDKTSISLRTANLGRVTFTEQSGITNAQRGNNILGFLREGLIRFLISIDICIVLLRSEGILVNDIDLSLAFVNKLKGLYEGMCKTVVAGPATNAKKNLVRDALKALLAEPLPVNLREALRKCVAARVPTNVGYPAYMKNVNTLVNIAWPVVQPLAVQAPGGLSPSGLSPVAQPLAVQAPIVKPPANLGLPPPGPPPPSPSGNQGFTEEQKGYFKTLGIEPTLDETAIVRAFRMASLKEHPNKGGNAEKFKLINNARDKLIELIQMRKTGLTPEQKADADAAEEAAEEDAAAAEEDAAAAARARASYNNARTRKEAEAAATEAAAARARANAVVPNVSSQVRAKANAIPLLLKNKPPAFTGAPQPTPAWMSNFAAQQAAPSYPSQTARQLPEGPGPGYTGPLAKMSNYQNSSPADEARLAAGNLVKGGNISASVPTTAEGLRAFIELQNIDNAPQFRSALSDGKRLRNKSGNSLTETDKKTLLLFKKYVTYSKEVDVTKPDQLKVRPGSSRKFTAKGNMLIAFGAKGGNDVLQLHPDNLILNETGFGITGMTTHNSGERFIYLEGLSPQQYDVMVSLIGKVKDILKNKFNPGGLTFGRGAEVYGGRRTRVAKRRTPMKKTRGSRKTTRRNRRS